MHSILKKINIPYNDYDTLLVWRKTFYFNCANSYSRFDLISCSYRVWSCIRCFVYANYSVYVVFITIVNVFKQLFIYKVYVLIIDVQNMSWFKLLSLFLKSHTFGSLFWIFICTCLSSYEISKKVIVEWLIQ